MNSEAVERMLAHEAARMKSPERARSQFILAITSEIDREMRRQKMTRKALAAKMGVSVSYVSQVLNSTSKFSLDRLSQILLALDVNFVFRCLPKNCSYSFSLVDEEQKSTPSTEVPDSAEECPAAIGMDFNLEWEPFVFETVEMEVGAPDYRLFLSAFTQTQPVSMQPAAKPLTKEIVEATQQAAKRIKAQKLADAA